MSQRFGIAFYRGTHPGLPGVYNRAVRAWERGDYSHTEMMFSDGMSASSSYMDGGVRFKKIDYSSDNWDFVYLPVELEAAAREYFKKHEGWPYDLMGNFHLVFGLAPEDKLKKFCSESCAEAVGLTDGWRFEPNVLYATLIHKYPQEELKAA